MTTLMENWQDDLDKLTVEHEEKMRRIRRRELTIAFAAVVGAFVGSLIAWIGRRIIEHA